MTEQNTIANELGAPPSSAWVRFLRTYGPTPNNLTMFDEYVAGAVGRAKVQPIALSAPMLEPMKAHVASGKPGSMLIAGTAGDGKTYHCRALCVGRTQTQCRHDISQQANADRWKSRM